MISWLLRIFRPPTSASCLPEEHRWHCIPGSGRRKDGGLMTTEECRLCGRRQRVFWGGGQRTAEVEQEGKE